MSYIFGTSVFLFFFCGMLWSNARRWRYLAKHYEAPSRSPVKERSWQSGVLLGLGGYNSLKGIVKIGLHETGISLRILKPFSLFHAPLFVPYSDIRGWGTTWYVDGKSTELQFNNAPDVKFVVPSEQAEWINNYAGQKMTLSTDYPPEGRAGRGWHKFAVAHAAFALVMISFLGYYMWTGQIS